MVKKAEVTFSFEGAEYRDNPLTVRWGRFIGKAKSMDQAVTDLIANMRKQHLIYQQVSTGMLSDAGNTEKAKLAEFFSLEPEKVMRGED